MLPCGARLRCDSAVREGSLPDSWAASMTCDESLVAATHAEPVLVALLTGGACESGQRLPWADAQ